MKKILILGAGPFQLPAIKKAVDLGLYVITLDYLPDNIGHRFSHESINCSTTDKDGVLAAALRLQIDGICTFSSDVAVPSVAYVAEFLGLPGISTKSADILSVKHQFRQFQQDNNLPFPRFTSGTSFEEIADSIHRLHYPLVFKPVDTSGSRGVQKVKSPDRNAELRAFEISRSYSRRGIVCIEEYIEGVEVGGDGFLLNGKFAFLAITQKHRNGFVVTGHSLPTRISTEDQTRVCKALENCCAALGYRSGPLNFDVMITRDVIYILEMSPRNGGNGIPDVILYATGVDLEKATLLFSIGETPEILEDRKRLNAGSWIFGSPNNGRLKSMQSFEALQKTVPEVFYFHQNKSLGEEVQRFEHNGNLLGYVLISWSRPQTYQDVVDKLKSALSLEIEPMKGDGIGNE